MSAPHIPSLEDVRENARIAEYPCGPNGDTVRAIQLRQGDLIQPGDWYLVAGHMHSEWCKAEAHSHGKPLREFHWPHIRIINPAPACKP